MMPLHAAVRGRNNVEVIGSVLRAYPEAAAQWFDHQLPLHTLIARQINAIELLDAFLEANPDATKDLLLGNSKLPDATVVMLNNSHLCLVGKS